MIIMIHSLIEGYTQMVTLAQVYQFCGFSKAETKAEAGVYNEGRRHLHWTQTLGL